jgi:hypothetical protein
MSGDYGIEDIIEELSELIRATLLDGQRKRAPSYWKNDPGHVDALHRHLVRYDLGELVDEDSKAHPLAHAGTRALMQAYQEIQPEGVELALRHAQERRGTLARPWS